MLALRLSALAVLRSGGWGGGFAEERHPSADQTGPGLSAKDPRTSHGRLPYWTPSLRHPTTDDDIRQHETMSRNR